MMSVETSSMIKTYELALNEIQQIFEKEKLLEWLNQIYISFDDILIDTKIKPDEELILKLWLCRNPYFY